jgi:hypothetical protein
VRVVQAACIPKASSPVVRFTYRGSFFIGTGEASWDKDVVRDIIRWMIWPEDPPLPPTGEDGRRQEAPEKMVHRLAELATTCAETDTEARAAGRASRV